MRKRLPSKQILLGLTFSLLGLLTSPARADFPVGTWLRTDTEGKGITVTVTVCCNGGRRLVYHLPVTVRGQPPTIMTVDLPGDGSEAPLLVGGKPSGETMTIKNIDDHHFQGTVKMNGQLTGTYTDTISIDGKSVS